MTSLSIMFRRDMYPVIFPRTAKTAASICLILLLWLMLENESFNVDFPYQKCMNEFPFTPDDSPHSE